MIARSVGLPARASRTLCAHRTSNTRGKRKPKPQAGPSRCSRYRAAVVRVSSCPRAARAARARPSTSRAPAGTSRCAADGPCRGIVAVRLDGHRRQGGPDLAGFHYIPLMWPELCLGNNFRQDSEPASFLKCPEGQGSALPICNLFLTGCGAMIAAARIVTGGRLYCEWPN